MTADDHMTPDDQHTLRALGSALPRVAPPPGLGEGITAAAASATPAGAPSHDAPLAPVVPIEQARRWRRRTVAASLAAAACAAALAVGITLSVTGPSAPDAPLTASAAVVGKGGGQGGLTGTASLYGATSPGGQVEVSLRDVPPPPAGHHYEVWVLEKGSDEMTAVGSFTPTSGTVDLTLPLPSPADYAAVDISVEPNGGPPAHSGTSLAGGAFSA